MKIPESFVEELRRSVDIVDVVSEHVQLRRSGRSYVGLCPFHNERSPSFSVSSERQVYHCFGCGAGGTVIRFVMDIDGLSFQEAIVKLAERASLELPVPLEQNADGQSSSLYQRMKDAHELAAKFYNYILMNTASGVQALAYLEKRGMSRQTIMEFLVGYAPSSGQQIISFLTRRGYEAKFLVEAGLAVDLGGKVVDRFRERVMIPIQDAQGQFIAFGGRTLQPDGKPKYLNSPETPVFRKSSVLFNLHRARKEMRKLHTAILFEGYMDTISAWQAGVRNGIATMGTAFTNEQAMAVKRYAERLITAYDGDDAGVKAAKRSIEAAETASLEARVVEFPDGLDPDDYIKAHGPEAFSRIVNVQAVSPLQFLLHDLRRNSNLLTTTGRTEFLRKALDLIGASVSPLEQETELRQLAQEFEVSLESLKEELTLVSKETRRRPARETTSAQPVSRPKQRGYIEAGNRLLQAMLLFPTVTDWLLTKGVDELGIPEQTALLALLYLQRAEGERSVHEFVDSLDDTRLQSLASSLLVEDGPADAPAEEILLDYLRTIRLHQLDMSLKEALAAWTKAEDLRLTEQASEWKKVIDEVQRQITQLKTPHRQQS